MASKTTLGEFGAESIWFTSIGIPTGTTIDLYEGEDPDTGEVFTTDVPMDEGVPEGFWTLDGTINEAGDEWAWDGQGEPRDWNANTVLAVKAFRTPEAR